MSLEVEQIPKQEDLHTVFLSGSIVPISHGSFLPDTIALLNTDGGRIYFGVNKYGKVIGLENSAQLIKVLEFRLTLSRSGIDKKYLEYIKIVKVTVEEKDVVVMDIRGIPKNQDFISIHGYYYFRQNNRTFRTDDKGMGYALKVIKYNFPTYSTYFASNLHSGEYREIIENDIKIQYIGDMPKGAYLYKYMDLESALLCLDNLNLRFVEPTNWEDQYEGRFYNANYYSDNDKRHAISSELTPFLYACCFTTKRENEAAWSLYSHHRSGLASRCVEFRLKRRELFDQLSDFVFDNPTNGKYPSIFFGSVIYEDKADIDNLHNKNSGNGNGDNVNYHKYFDNFSLECYLNLLLLKRIAFEHEKEIRVFIVPLDQKSKEKTKRNRNGKFFRGKTPHCEYVKIAWYRLIEEVRIDKNCSQYEKSILQRKLDYMYELQKNYLLAKGESFDDTKLKSKFQLVEFDPYEDKSLKKGPISIIAN